MSALGLDPHVQAYTARLAAVGLGVRPYEAVALSRFTRRAKLAGYWDRLDEIIPMCGRNAAATLYKLKYVSTSKMTANGTYSESRYSPRAGVIGNNVMYFETGWVPITHLTNNSSLMIGVGFLKQSGSGFSFIAGTDQTHGTTGKIAFNIDGGLGGTGNWFGGWVPLTTFGGANLGSITAGSGFYIANRTSNVAATAYKNGAQIGTSSADNTGTPMPNTQLVLMGDGLGAVTKMAANDRVLFACIGRNFTSTDVTELSADYTVLMQDLRRAF